MSQCDSSDKNCIKSRNSCMQDGSAIAVERRNVPDKLEIRELPPKPL